MHKFKVEANKKEDIVFTLFSLFKCNLQALYSEKVTVFYTIQLVNKLQLFTLINQDALPHIANILKLELKEIKRNEPKKK